MISVLSKRGTFVIMKTIIKEVTKYCIFYHSLLIKIAKPICRGSNDKFIFNMSVQLALNTMSSRAAVNHWNIFLSHERRNLGPSPRDGKTLSSVIEYKFAFFVALIYLFDKVIARGLLHMINFF